MRKLFSVRLFVTLAVMNVLAYYATGIPVALIAAVVACATAFYLARRRQK